MRLPTCSPDRFEDIIALVALYRPGPMANIPTYCARKRGTEQPEYLHPKIEPILRETFGVIIYQEQVMQIAQVLLRLFARRSRHAAPTRWARRSGRRWKPSATASFQAQSSVVSSAAGRCDL